MSKPAAPPEENLAKLLDGFKVSELFKDTEELAATQPKAAKAWEANKLAKRNARPPKTAVRDVSTALQRQKTAQAKEQAKLVELEAAAKAAADAVEEAKQKAIKRQEDIDRLQAKYDQELARLIQTKDSVTRDAFQALSGCVEVQPLLSQMASAFTGMLAAVTPTPAATDERNDDIDMQPDKGLTVEAVARALHAVVGRTHRRRERGQGEYVERERRA